MEFGRRVDMSDTVSMGLNPVTLLMGVIASIVSQRENTVDTYWFDAINKFALGDITSK